MTAAETLLDIGDVSRRTGLAPSTLRFYEDRGLITSAARRGLRRQYSPDVVRRLAVVILCQQAGFTLPEVAEVLASDGRPEWRQLVADKRDEIMRRIEDLTVMAEGLTHALGCPSPEVLQCPHFQAELDRVIPADPAVRKRARPAGPATTAAAAPRSGSAAANA